MSPHAIPRPEPKTENTQVVVRGQSNIGEVLAEDAGAVFTCRVGGPPRAGGMAARLPPKVRTAPRCPSVASTWP